MDEVRGVGEGILWIHGFITFALLVREVAQLIA